MGRGAEGAKAEVRGASHLGTSSSTFDTSTFALAPLIRLRLITSHFGSSTLFVLAPLVALACTHAPPQNTAPSSPWTRDIAPFSVLDSAGAPYEHAFLGGFDVPRPQLIDIDGDGDLDLFIQERSDEVMFLENVGTPRVARFVWRTDKYADLDVAEWYRFVDLDLDGDYDLLTEQPFSAIRYYRNDGTAAAAAFVLAVDTLRTPDGEPIFSDRQNIPNAVDLDCDGLVDLFIGRLTGTVMRYQAVDRSPAPRFRPLTERFEDIEIVANVLEAGSRHGANTMDFADIDDDGDHDLFWGDFFEPGILLIENTGTCAAPSLRGEPVPFPPGDPVRTTGYNAPTVSDLNGDGQPDMLIGVLGGAYNPIRSARENLYHLEHTATGFELRTRRFLRALDIGSESIPALADVDGDGDLDLLVGSKIEADAPTTGRIHYFENAGTSDRPTFRARAPLPLEGSYHYAPELADLTGDGVPDLVAGSWRNEVLFFRNVPMPGAPQWEAASEPLVVLTRGSNTTPALGDVDGDGDLDLVVGESSGALNLYRNTGTPASPVFELVSDEWLGLDFGRRSHPAFTDIDGDGDQDLIVGSEEGALRVLRNDGRAGEVRFVEDTSVRLPSWPYAAPTFADLDGDGQAELVMGGLSGGLVYYRR